jgi:excinuclease ABC subunit B
MLSAEVLSTPPNSAHIRPMAKTPDLPKKPGKSPKSKAGRPDVQPIGPALAELLNPAINRGDAGTGSGTGLQPPPDNSWDRRAGGEAAAHRARASTRGKSEDVAERDNAPAMPLRPNPQPPGARSNPEGLDEAPQANYGTSATIPTLDPELARQLGLPTAEDDDEALARPPRSKMEAFGVKATAGESDPRGPARVQEGRRLAESVDAASPAPPGEIRRRRPL